jgi:hypothetical protein
VGQDIGKKGGNYGVTDGLQRKFGCMRVRDALLDETSILGMYPFFLLACAFATQNLFFAPLSSLCSQHTPLLPTHTIGARTSSYTITIINLKFTHALILPQSAGMANGFSLNGLFPVVEVCYLAYIHNAIDQLRGM